MALVISELATGALRYGAAPIRLRLTRPMPRAKVIWIEQSLRVCRWTGRGHDPAPCWTKGVTRSGGYPVRGRDARTGAARRRRPSG
ncbi:hypothetical protein SGFS_100220 [Streptomyces graminofaciens]|uniref:Uncharacterized protein n=1 Tax=Streptomyces graminofaciens TaxID=68212 RepID=A0ABN5W3U9_9ACTN|nr:hypothetical protein SGFS_100220 [Streptomyces graminofaciens]